MKSTIKTVIIKLLLYSIWFIGGVITANEPISGNNNQQVLLNNTQQHQQKPIINLLGILQQQSILNDERKPLENILLNDNQNQNDNNNKSNEKQRRIYSRKGVEFDATSKTSSETTKTKSSSSDEKLSSIETDRKSMSNEKMLPSSDDKIIDITKDINENILKSNVTTTAVTMTPKNTSPTSTIEKSNISVVTHPTTNHQINNNGTTTTTVSNSVAPLEIKSTTNGIINNSTSLNNSTTVSTSTTSTTTTTTTTTTMTTPSTTTTTTTTTTPKPIKPSITYGIEDDPTILQVDPPFGSSSQSQSQSPPSSSTSMESNAADNKIPQHTLNAGEPHIFEQPIDDSQELIIIERNNRQLIIPMVALIFAIPMLLGIGTVLWRRAKEYWTTRYYRRMDFLVDGMYCD